MPFLHFLPTIWPQELKMFGTYILKNNMIVSVNPEAHRNEFDTLINSTITELNVHAKKSPSRIGQLKGNKLEPYVGDSKTIPAINHLDIRNNLS